MKMVVFLEKNEFAVERSKTLSGGSGRSARGRTQKVKLLFLAVDRWFLRSIVKLSFKATFKLFL